MSSLRRIVLTALLGAIIVTSIGVAVGQSSGTPEYIDLSKRVIVMRGALYTVPPDMAAPPENSAERYSPQWWVAEAEVEKWRQKYARPVLVILPAAIDRPVYTLSGDGAATAVAVVPMHGLWSRRAAIAAGHVLWAPLDDAFSALTAPPPVTNDATAAALQRAREAAAKAVEILTQP